MAGLLGRRDLPAHREQMAAHGIAPIDLLVSNLYPFEATVASGAADADCVENIDIGGPALIRAAAKNHDHVAVVTDVAQYDALLAAIHAGGTTLALRRQFAAAAYARTAAYDAAIAAWFAAAAGGGLSRPPHRGRDAAAGPCATARTRTSGPRSTSMAPAPAAPPRARSKARSCRSTTSTTRTPHSNAWRSSPGPPS